MTETNPAGASSESIALHVIAVGLHDRPGAAHSVADVFSVRGLQMEAFQGTSDSLSAGGDASLLILFRAAPDRANLVTRVLRRLSSVRYAERLDATDPRLIQTVLVAGKGSAPDGIRLIPLDPDTALAVGTPAPMHAWLHSEHAPIRLGAVRLDYLSARASD